MKRPRRGQGLGLLTKRDDDDIVAVVANLFDVGIVLALGFMVALISALNLLDVFDPDQKVTITKERADGMEITVREGQKTTTRRLSKTVGSGDGTRVGIAYRLEDGSVVYVPEGSDTGADGAIK